MADPQDQFDELHWEMIDVLQEGRATPNYLSERTGESRQLVSQRLRDLRLSGVIEKIHKGLYELDEDAPDAPDDSGETDGASNGPSDTRNVATGHTPPQNESGSAADPQASTSSTTPDDLPAALDGVKFPGNRDVDECARAVLAARNYLREHESASMSEIVAGVMPKHPAGYNAESDVERINDPEQRNRSTWWRKIVRPGLEALPDVESPPKGGSAWEHVGRDDEGTGSGGVYDPTGEF